MFVINMEKNIKLEKCNIKYLGITVLCKYTILRNVLYVYFVRTQHENRWARDAHERMILISHP